MQDKIIEPSEIIVEQTKYRNENPKRANPLLRFIARFFDYSLFLLVLLFSRKFFHGHIPFSHYEYFIPFEYFIWIPIEALFLSLWGVTPGKWFLKIKLKQGKREKLAYRVAFRRSLAVWFRGLGMNLIGLNFFCLLLAYNRLRLRQITSWDRDDHIVVTHGQVANWRICVAVLVAAGGILYYYSEKNSELNHVSRSHIRSFDEYPSSPLIAARFDL